MLTEHQIRQTIKDRLMAVNGSCNSAHLDHNDGVFRGLIWALTGNDHGTYLTKNVPNLLDLAEIPYQINGGRIELTANETAPKMTTETEDNKFELERTDAICDRYDEETQQLRIKMAALQAFHAAWQDWEVAKSIGHPDPDECRVALLRAHQKVLDLKATAAGLG